jgi:hypothetical protein
VGTALYAGGPAKRLLSKSGRIMKLSNSFSASIVVLLLAVYGGEAAYSKDWKGIVPLHSNRQDVERILGVKLSGKDYDELVIGDNKIFIRYTHRECNDKYLSGFNVPKGTVLSIAITPLSFVRVADLGLDLTRFRKGYTDVSGMVSYWDEAAGFSINVQNDKVLGFEYSVSSKDYELRCPQTRKEVQFVRRPCEGKAYAFDPSGSYYMEKGADAEYVSFDHFVLRAEQDGGRRIVTGGVRSLDGVEYDIQEGVIIDRHLEFHTRTINGIQFRFIGDFGATQGAFAALKGSEGAKLLFGTLERMVDAERTVAPSRGYVYAPKC